MSKRIRILIIDDHPMLRRGLEATIEPEPDMEVAGSAANGPEGVRLFRETQPDITIMDLGLTPEMSGIEAIREIRQVNPQARVIVVTALRGEEDIYSAIQAGAVTFLLKDKLGDDLIPILREVHAGGGPIPQEVARKLTDRLTMASLTARETEVLRLMAQGLRNKEIAGILKITDQTTQGHVKNILSKLKVHDRTEAVTLGIRRGLIHLDRL